MGDDTTIIENEYESYTDIPTYLRHRYSQIGKYDVNITICNCINCSIYELESVVGIPISNPSYITNDTLVLNENATFVLTLGNSSETTCFLDFDDSYYEMIYERFTGDTIISVHAYYTFNLFSSNVYCENHFGNYSDSKKIIVQIPISGMIVNTTMIYATYGTIIPISIHLEYGSDIEFMDDCDGRTCGEFVGNGNLSAVFLFNTNNIPSYGIFNISLCASNDLNSECKFVLGKMTKALKSILLDKTPIVGTPGEAIVISATCDNGSMISFQFFTGNTENFITMTYPDNTLTSSINYVYDKIGVYELSVAAANNISAAIDTANVIIEYPIPDLNDVFRSSVTNVSDTSMEVTLIGHFDGGNHDPTFVMISCDFGEGTPNVVQPVSLTPNDEDADFELKHKYEDFGQYTINCTLYNNVSKQVFIEHASVGVPISGLGISVSASAVGVNRTINFKVHVDSGSNLDYSIEPGDGNVLTDIKRSNTNWTDPDYTIVSYMYSRPDTAYTVNVKAVNVFGEVGPENLEITILVDYAIPELMLITDLYHQVYKQETFVLKPVNAMDYPPAAPVRCVWIIKGQQPESNEPEELLTMAEHLHGISVNEPGNYTTLVLCSNTVSKVAASASFIAEITIDGLSIQNVPGVLNIDKYITAEISLNTGSHIYFTINFGDGSNPESAMRYTNEMVPFQYKYQTSGMYNISVSTVNHVSNQSIIVTITVQKPVKCNETQIKVTDFETGLRNMTAIRDGIGGKLNITIDVTPGMLIPTDVLLNISYTSGYNDVTFKIPDYPYTIVIPEYNITGNFKLLMTLYNKISTCNFTIPFQVQELPRSPNISMPILPVIYTFPIGVFEVNVTYGSHYTITLDFGNGHVENITVENERGFKRFDFSEYIYPLPGYYSVKIYLRNEFVYFVTEKELTVVGDLPNMTLVTNSPVEFKLDNNLLTSTFKLEINPEDRLPLDCNLKVDFGDSQENLVNMTSINDDIQWTHVYPSPNYYYVHINVSTLFDIKHFEATMRVQVPLSEVTIRKNIPKQSEEEDTYIVGTALQFTAVHNSGTGANYTWTFINKDSGSVYHTEVTNATHIILVMGDIGSYLVYVVANNGLGLPRNATDVLQIVPNGIITKFDYMSKSSIGEYNVFNLELLDEYNIPPYSYDDLCINLSLGMFYSGFHQQKYIA